MQCCIPADNGGGEEPDDSLDIVFWINAFIPLNFEDETVPIPNHPGQTMVALGDNPLAHLAGCFATDQRSFSNSQGASARMHSETRIRIDASTYDWTQAHYCGPTIKVDCDSGAQTDVKTADPDMSFSLTQGSSSRVVLDFVASAHNPFSSLAPRIDIVGTLTVDRIAQTVDFFGKVDDFPAFEAYAFLNGAGPYTVATLGPEPGSDPLSLFGDANRPFNGRLYV